MTLRQARINFTKLLCQLIMWGNNQPGYEVALGRDFDEDNEPLRHMKNSLHYSGLANDLALYIDGVYQEDTKAYRRLGEAWEAMGPNCAWGGRFEGGDGNHFSYKFGGKK